MKKINTFGQQLINANDEMLTVEEVAQLFKVKPASIRKKVQRGTIPSHKIKGSKRRWFSKVELMSMIKSDDES